MTKINQTYKNLFILILVAGSFFIVSKTLAVGQSFRAGETLNPECGPLDPTCTVRLLDLYNEKSTNGTANTVTGTNAIAIGSGSTASGDYSIAIGHEDPNELFPGGEALGDYAVAIGTFSNATGIYSTALSGGTAMGDFSLSVGMDSQSAGTRSIAIGEGIRSPSFREITIGSYPLIYEPASSTEWDSSDPIFSVGNGQDGQNRSTAFGVLKSGETVANGDLTVNGNFKVADTVTEIPAFNSEITFTNGGIRLNDGALSIGSGGILFRRAADGDADPELTINAKNRTDAIVLPQGETAERPAGAPAGAIRYNTELNVIEITKALDTWSTLDGGGAEGLIDQNYDLSDPADVAPSANGGENSIAIGLGTTTSSKGEISLGTYPLATSDGGDFADDNVVFSVGSGVSNDDKKNSMTILRNGQTGLGNISQDDLRNANNIAILTDTGAFLSTDGTWTNASDQSLKTNIKTLGYGLDEVLELKPRQFNFEKSGKAGIGFIAQEIEDVIPEVVSESGLGTKGVEYAQLTAVLVNAIIELENRVEYLESSSGARAPAVEREEEEFVELEEEPAPEEEAPAEEVIEEEPAPEENQEASLIKSSNTMNVTNLLLMLAVALLAINLAVVAGVKKFK